MLDSIFEMEAEQTLTLQRIIDHLTHSFQEEVQVIESEDCSRPVDHQIYYNNQNLSYSELKRRQLISETLQGQENMDDFNEYLAMVEELYPIIR